MTLIAKAVAEILKTMFPDKYPGLCHAYAIVGACVLSACCERVFRPVAGVGVIPTGCGTLEMLDDLAFFRPSGGAYHCWIESADEEDPLLVDFSFANNAEYAQSRGMPWAREAVDLMYGPSSDLNLAVKYASPPDDLPGDKVWFNATENGRQWIAAHQDEHQAHYTELCALVLRLVKFKKLDYLREQSANMLREAEFLLRQAQMLEGM